MASLCFWIIWHVFLYTARSISHSAFLTTRNASHNGAIVTALKDVETTTKWSMTATDRVGFHLQLSMDSQFAFHPTLISRVSIIVDSDTSLDIYNNDLLMAFSQSDSAYCALELKIDYGSGRWNYIYPGCDKLYELNTSFANGNVFDLCNANTGEQREVKINQNGDSEKFSAAPAPIAVEDKYPFRFTLENHPGLYTLFKYEDEAVAQETCVFTPGFHSDLPLDVFFAADDTNEYFDVLYINVTYTDDSIPITTTPISVTVDPTLFPSQDPSASPFKDPSTSPSSYPTKNPTPSSSRTLSTTPSPTTNPTTLPILDSTESLTLLSSRTLSTTISPTIYPTVSSLSSSPSTLNIVVSSVLSLLIIIIGYLCWDKNKNRKQQLHNAAQHMQIHVGNESVEIEQHIYKKRENEMKNSGANVMAEHHVEADDDRPEGVKLNEINKDLNTNICYNMDASDDTEVIGDDEVTLSTSK